MAPDHPTAAPQRTTSVPDDRPPHIIWPARPSGPSRWGVAAAVLAVAVLIGAATTAVRRPVTSAPPRPAPAIGAERAVVDVDSQLGWKAIGAAGTGLVVDPTGVVATNNHVIAGATEITVTLSGSGRTYPATVLGYDVAADLAVLRVGGAGRLAAAVVSTGRPRLGQAVTVIGNAWGLGGRPARATGVVAGMGQSVTAVDPISGTVEKLSGVIAVTAPVVSGESGGPVVDDRGRVIGLDAAGSGGRRVPPGAAQGYAIPIAEVLALVREVLSGRPSAGVHIGPTAFLGVETTDAPGAGDRPVGALVYSVYPGAPASGAGIAAGDTIIALAGHPITSPAAVSAVIDRLHPDHAVEVDWIGPAGDHHAARVVLTSGPPA